jgi:hypothetical protein
MNETYSAEIYRQEGAEFRSVRLSVCADGSVCLDAQDMGKITEEIWGDADYEFWMFLPWHFLTSCLLYSVRNILIEAVLSMNSARFAKKKGSNTNGTVGSNYRHVRTVSVIKGAPEIRRTAPKGRD